MAQKKKLVKFKDFEASIICCIYNEVNLIETNLVDFIKKIKLSKRRLEIIVIDNNSSDGTKERLMKIKKKKILKNLIFVFNKKNLGKGGSVKRACDIARGNYCCVFDIDEYFAEDLLKGISLAKKDSLDLLIGSRIGEKHKYIYKANYYGVRFLTYLINLFFGTNLTDSAGAIKIFKRLEYRNITVNASGFDFEFELICKFAKAKLKISEFQNKYKPRTYEEGKKLTAIKDGSKILIAILKCIFK